LFEWDEQTLDILAEARGSMSRSFYVWQKLWDDPDFLRIAKKKKIAKPQWPKGKRGGDRKSEKFRQSQKE